MAITTVNGEPISLLHRAYNRIWRYWGIRDDDFISESAARERHCSDHPSPETFYTALIGGAEHPKVALEVSAWSDGILLQRCDALGRPVQVLTFETAVQPAAGDRTGLRLFLSHVSNEIYDGEAREYCRYDGWEFKPDGRWLMVRKGPRFADLDATVRGEGADLTHHWDVWPEFGRYESLIDPDRRWWAWNAPRPLPSNAWRPETA